MEAKLLACKTAEKGTGAAGSNNGTARLSADGPTTAVVKNPPRTFFFSSSSSSYLSLFKLFILFRIFVVFFVPWFMYGNINIF